MAYKSIFDIQLTPPEGKQFFWVHVNSAINQHKSMYCEEYRLAQCHDIKADELLPLLNFLEVGRDEKIDIVSKHYLELDNDSPIEYRDLTLMIRPFTNDYSLHEKMASEFILKDKLQAEAEREAEIMQEKIDFLDKINARATGEIPDMKNSENVIVGEIGCPPPLQDYNGQSFFSLEKIKELTMPYLEAIDKVKFMNPFTCKHCDMDIVPYKIKFDGYDKYYVRNDMYYELLEKETGVKLTKDKKKTKVTPKKKVSPKKTVKKAKFVKKETKKAVKKPLKKQPVKPKVKAKPKLPKKKTVKR